MLAPGLRQQDGRSHGAGIRTGISGGGRARRSEASDLEWQERITRAQTMLPGVVLTGSVLRYIAEMAIAAQVEGVRADIVMAQASRDAIASQKRTWMPYRPWLCTTAAGPMLPFRLIPGPHHSPALQSHGKTKLGHKVHREAVRGQEASPNGQCKPQTFPGYPLT